MDIQATQQTIQWAVYGITIVLMIIAASIAIKKKNNLVLMAAVLGNLIVYYFTLSPLLCMAVSVVCMIWASFSGAKSAEVPDVTGRKVKNLKTPKANVIVSEEKKMVKAGPIVGLILGILMAGAPIAGMLMGEASLSDPKGRLIGIGFIIFGAFLVIVNIIVLATGKENLLASSSEAQSPASAKVEKSTEGKIRCRFCKRLYSADYNGCPYCKKK